MAPKAAPGRRAYPPPPPPSLVLLCLLLGTCGGAGAVHEPPDLPPYDALSAPTSAMAAEAEWLRDADTTLLNDYLSHALRSGWPDAQLQLPLLFLDDADAAASEDRQSGLASAPASGAATAGAAWKRSRYYRRYPWKRQPGRGGGMVGDADNPYLCNPTREDVFQLLVALHEARSGNLGRTLNFCNRRRPAANVFTNIRFLGRRR